MTRLAHRKLASSADEFRRPLQFQLRMPMGGDKWEDVDVVDGPGFGWTHLMKRRMRRSWRGMKDEKGCRHEFLDDDAGVVIRLKKGGRMEGRG